MKNDDRQQDSVTVKEAARQLSRTSRSVTDLLKKGHLKGTNPTGRKWLITQTSVDVFKGGPRLDETVQTSLSPSAGEARRKHFEDLLSLAREWKEHLVFDVGDAILVQESKVPSSFSKRDGTAGWHELGPLVWLVRHDGDVEVCMAIERRARLFPALIEHLASEVRDTYEALKSEVAAGIKMAANSPGRIHIPEVTNLVFALAEKLDVVLDSRVLGGNCEVCRRIADQGVI